MENPNSHDTARPSELKLLETAVNCFVSELSTEQIKRLHRALMFKGPALDAINGIINEEVDSAPMLEGDVSPSDAHTVDKKAV